MARDLGVSGECEPGEDRWLRRYPSRNALAEAVAARLAAEVRGVIGRTGGARIAVPGGTTPAPMLRLLGEAALDWSRVAITLTDERGVPADSERSNQRMVRGTLLAGPAAAARFVPLHRSGGDLGEVRASLERQALPLDIAVLGMGGDMHVASLFPGAEGLGTALAAGAPAVLEIVAPGAPEPRVTLSARVLAGAGARHIVIAGKAKLEALQRARGIGDARLAPVCAVLDGAAVHYAE